MTRYRFATPRPGEDVLTRVPRRTGAPHGAVKVDASRQERGAIARLPSGAPYRMAVPRMAHPAKVPDFGQQPRYSGVPTDVPRSRIAPDLLALAVILAVVLAASLAGVRL